MIRAAALLAAVLTATGAGAVTPCDVPHPVEAATLAQAAPGEHAVLHGRLAFDPGLIVLPDAAPVDMGGMGRLIPARAGRPMPARFEGRVLDRMGVGRPVAATVTLIPHCPGGWEGAPPTPCDWFAPVRGWLLFARVADGGYVVELSTCGRSSYPDPDPATLDAIAACLRDGACGAPGP